MKEIRNNETINSTNSESRLVEGYAVVFNSRSVDLGGFYEVIEKGALDGVVEKSDVVCLLDHDIKRGVLARSRNGNGSLQLTIDDKGLYFCFEAPKTSLGDEILEGVKRGDISSCSFAFTVDDDEYTQTEDGTIIRTIKKIDELFDISLVYKPAYDETEVDTRGLNEFLKTNNTNNIEVSMKKDKRNTENLPTKDEEKEKDLENKSDETQEEEKEECREEENPDETDSDVEDEDSDEVEEEREDEDSDDEEIETESETEKEDEDEVETESDDEEEKEEEKRNKTKKHKESRNKKHNIMNKKFSLISSINDVVNNRSFNDASKEVISRSQEIARKNGVDFGNDQIVISNLTEKRAVQNPNGILSTEATYGQEAVQTELFDIVGALRDKMVLADAGARFINVNGNVEIPVYSGSTCGWADEIGEAVDGSGKFTSIKLTPKRITAVLPVSRLFLAQTSDSAEALLREDLINCIAEKLQQTILGDGAGSDVEPAGIFNGVSADADFTYNDVVEIEKELEENNFNTDNAKWVVAPSTKAIVRTQKIDEGSGRFVMENGEILGVPALTTSSVVEKGAVYGDFSELIIANWDSLSILVDQFTLAAKNQVRLVVHFYVNYALRRTDALVKKIGK